jgi:hypothetical protein
MPSFSPTSAVLVTKKKGAKYWVLLNALDSYNLNLREYLSDFKFQIFLARVLLKTPFTNEALAKV